MIRIEVVTKLMQAGSQRIAEVSETEKATLFEVLSAYASMTTHAFEVGVEAGAPYRVVERAAWEILAHLNEKKGPGDAPKDPVNVQ